MQRLASLFELLGAGSNGIAFEQFEAELTRLMAVPELREALSPARGFLALERRGPGYFMQCALDTPGTPLFDAAVAHLAVWKGRVLVHAPLELPPLKVGAIAVADKAVLIGHDLGVTTLDRMTLEVQRTLPLKGSPRHILEWIDLEAPSPNIQRVALAGTAGRFVAADGATGRVLWVEGSDVMLLHAREDRREVFPLPETQNVAFFPMAAPAPRPIVNGASSRRRDRPRSSHEESPFKGFTRTCTTPDRATSFMSGRRHISASARSARVTSTSSPTQVTSCSLQAARSPQPCMRFASSMPRPGDW
jgi:hypothetical protein